MDIDSFVESLWLRALDLTSKDFKSEKAYLTGKANYEKLARQALQSYIDTKIIEAELATFKGIRVRSHSVTMLIPFDDPSVKELFDEIDDCIKVREEALNHREDSGE